MRNFSDVTKKHFRKKNWGNPIYGVYIIRNKQTAEILYIGISGTYKKRGYADQDLPKRLNTGFRRGSKNEKITTYEWIKKMYEEIKGTLLIEYIILPKNEKNNKSPIPTYIEALLLQAFVNDNGCLPLKKKEF